MLVALLLVAMLSVVTFLAYQSGAFDGPNDESVDAAAIGAATEFLQAQSRGITRTWMAPGTRRWQRCARDDRTWPCGAEPDPARREALYRYQFGVDDPGTRHLDERLAIAPGHPPSRDGARAGAASAALVGALLCMVDATDPSHPGCSTSVDSARGWDGRFVISLVALAPGSSGDESGTIAATIGSYRAISGPPDIPIIASGEIRGLGRAEVVPAPNAGGFGVPLSLWTRSDADLTDGGALQTCHLGEFLAHYVAGGATSYDGITICPDCRCRGLDLDRGLLSGQASGVGDGASAYEGIDILDVDGSSAASPRGALPDATYFPFHPLDDAANALDDSLFEYVFGVDNASEADSALLDADRNGSDDGRDYLERISRILSASDCRALDSSAQGLLYVPPDASCRIGGQVGTPSAPVALVVDGDAEFADGTVFYGLVFGKRSIARASAMRIAGAMQLYGALVVEGGLEIAGSPQFIYNELVLRNLMDSAALERFGGAHVGDQRRVGESGVDSARRQVP